jgi:hypothetical protein
MQSTKLAVQEGIGGLTPSSGQSESVALCQICQNRQNASVTIEADTVAHEMAYDVGQRLRTAMTVGIVGGGGVRSGDPLSRHLWAG